MLDVDVMLVLTGKGEATVGGCRGSYAYNLVCLSLKGVTIR